MKHYFDMRPVRKWHTNNRSSGRDALPEEVSIAEGGKIHAAPMTVRRNSTLVVYKCSSVWWRLRFLFTGEVTMVALGDYMPPMAVCVGDSMGPERKNTP